MLSLPVLRGFVDTVVGAVGERREPTGVEAGRGGDLLGRDGTAVETPEQEVGQRPARRRLVEDARGLSLDVVAQPGGGGRETPAVEGERRGVPGRQLGGMQVPALVVAPLQRAAHESQVLGPGSAHRGGVPDRQHVAGPVGEADAGAGGRDLHDRLGVVGDRVGQALVGGGDPAVGAVVVGAVVQPGAASVGRVDHPGHEGSPVRPEDRLRGLDLQLEAQRAGRQAEPGLQAAVRCGPSPPPGRPR